MSKAIRHTLVWLGIYVVYTVMLSINGDPIAVMLLNLLHILLYIMTYYLLRNVQIPYLYDTNKIGLFIASLMVSSLAFYGLYRIGLIYWLEGIRGISSKGHYTLLGDYLLMTIRFYSPAMALLALESYFEGRKEQVRIQRLEKEKLANELKFLKAQINPQFLSNTLNNLYTYVLNESPKAPEMILQLSGILDYLLYRSQQPTVLLSEEVQTIEHFLSLEKIRYGDKLDVQLQTEGDLSIPISPLILLSLVENAFKHGASSNMDHPKIRIHIFEKNENIHCEVWNTKSSSQGKRNDTYKKGIGLTNIQRQLTLVYPQRHELNIEEENGAFSVTLKIQKDEHH